MPAHIPATEIQFRFPPRMHDTDEVIKCIGKYTDQCVDIEIFRLSHEQEDGEKRYEFDHEGTDGNKLKVLGSLEVPVHIHKVGRDSDSADEIQGLFVMHHRHEEQAHDKGSAGEDREKEIDQEHLREQLVPLFHIVFSSCDLTGRIGLDAEGSEDHEIGDIVHCGSVPSDTIRSQDSRRIPVADQREQNIQQPVDHTKDRVLEKRFLFLIPAHFPHTFRRISLYPSQNFSIEYFS